MLTEQSVINQSSRRQLQKADTRKRILSTAAAVYAEHGITATRSADVARAAGVAHGTLFLHFPTQEDLITAVIDDFGEGLCRRLHELTHRGNGIKALLEAHLAAIAEREDFYARLVSESSVLPEAARTSLVMIQSTASFHMSRAAEAGMAEGSIRRLPFPLLFNTWMGLVHYYLANRELFAPGASVIGRRGTEILEYFMSLIEGG
jgi:AcrR family transcriptional regulator